MIINYHEKTANGWELVASHDHGSKNWGSLDRWAISHLMLYGSMVLTMGHSMWEIKQ